jgi:hypothetical protein
MVAILAILLLLAGAATASAQDTGAGKLEVGGFPLGGTFFIGGDGDEEVNFNVYSTGLHLTNYFSPHVAVEGELTISFGLAQDLTFKGDTVFHMQVPNVWSYFGNVVFFPGGASGRRMPFYLTGGIGAVSLQSRGPTAPLGYDVDTVGWETFLAENIGAGVKLFRGAAAPQWGFRVDYRYLIVNANENAPAFFAKEKTRGGHRVYFGILYTIAR